MQNDADEKQTLRISLTEKISAYVELTHSYFSLIAGIMSFSAAVVAARGLPSPWLSFVTIVAPTLGSAAGTAANDYFHRKVDRYEKHWRPIPSGRISPTNAFIFACTLALIAFALTLTLSPLAYIIALGTFLSTLVYNLGKKIRFMGPPIRALADVFCILYGYVAVAGTLTLEVIPIALIFFTDVVSSNIGPSSVKDTAGDEAGGVITPSVRLGQKKVAKIGFAFLVVSIALGLWPYLVGLLNLVFLCSFVVTRIPTVWAYGKLVKTPITLFSEFAMATQLFCRGCFSVSFAIGVLPVAEGIILAVAIIFLSALSTTNYYTYLIVERLQRGRVSRTPTQQDSVSSG
jgi:4-hydroxybenzoate polyprenyltransferase